MKKYESLYNKYRSQIIQGSLAPGERLPSLREEARSSGLSMNTVISAYNRLGDEGWIQGRERGGFFVRHRIQSRLQADQMASLPEHFVSEGRASGDRLDLIFERLLIRDASFAVAAPGMDLLPVDKLEEALEKLKRSWLNYAEPAGDRIFRQRIARTLEASTGNVDGEDIIICNGATEALTLVLRTTLQAGDTVVLESPTYFNYFRQLSPLGVKILEIPMGPGGMDLDCLERELRVRKIQAVLVQPNVQNPTGITMDDASKARLVSLAEQYSFTLIQDDVYGDLYYGPQRPKNLLAFSNSGKIVMVSSYSKSIAPGLRIGFIVSPRHTRRYEEEKLHTSFESCRIAQFVLADFIATADHRRHLVSLCIALENRVDEYISFLEQLLPEASALHRPSGGCLLWIALPPSIDATEVFESAARKGLIAAPGELFSANPFFRSYLRINAGYALSSERKKALSALTMAINTAF